MESLHEKYKKEIVPILMKELGIGNPMAVPKLVKVVVNCGLGSEVIGQKNSKAFDAMTAQLAVITGQKPMITRAKRAISTFKLRSGDAVGVKSTIRGKRMYDFVSKLTSISLPRVRDFRGVSAHGFDGHGNYTLGISEQTIFPELAYEMVDKIRGFEVTFVTTARDDTAAKRLLELIGIPFEK